MSLISPTIDKVDSSVKRNHPCFYAESKGRFGRIHLPVAPSCNIQCSYCRRDQDCPHENRPGVSSGIITPEEALARLVNSLKEMTYISVAGIAGPGDAFSEPILTLKTFELIRRKDIKTNLCVSSNGFNVLDHVPSLSDLKVQFVTITINTIDPGIGTVLYDHVNTTRGKLKGVQASELLIERQLATVSALKASGFTVKVNTVVLPGINDHHIPFLAKRMQGIGVDLMNLIPLIPLPATSMANLSPPSPLIMNKLRQLAGHYVPQMSHCQRCRSDAAGLFH